MNMKNKLLCGKWKRWTALLMVVVMIFLQPCTVLADAGIRGKETVSGKDEVKQIQEGMTKSSGDNGKESPETASDEKQEIPLNEKLEELPAEDFETLSEVETEISTEELSETGYSAGIETEESTEDSLTESETEQRVLTDFETEELDETDSAIIQEAETEIPEDTFSQKQKSEKIYTVTFYTDNIIVDTQAVEEGGTAEEPEVPQKPGYTFIGWSGDYTRVTNSRNIYARYATGEFITHTVTFLDYDGRLVGNRQYVQDGGDASSPVRQDRVGFTFLGWDNSRFNIKGNKILSAQYCEGVLKTYTLNYFGYCDNKASWCILKEETIVEGEDGVPPELEEIEGYTFAGWDKVSLYTNVYTNRNIFAKYYTGKYQTHKVEFVDYNGRPLLNPQYVADGGDAASPSEPYREGYTFTGWDKSRFRVHKDVKLTAQYRKGEHKTYTLNYFGYCDNKASSRILKEETVVEGEDGVPPELEEIEGYTFAGWDKVSLYTNVYTNRNIFAKYYTGKYQTHKVEFVDYNGRPLLNPQYIIDGGGAASPSIPYREGYTFRGWDKEFYRITAPVKIQALYKEGNYTTYPVSFYGKITGNPNWQWLKTEYVPAGEEAHPPKLPINAGYTFREWTGNITGIHSSQNVYAQYDKIEETETTYTVRFWCRGEVIKTEEVAVGGNATPPPVPGVKGYSFAGWDKSYVNINPGTRSMAVDITAQYQLTSGIQNAGSLTDLANALMALGVPVAVKNGFAALGAAIINPFDGIILDVLAATALVATIIYYWDDIKGLWEDIKTVFQNFAGMDAAGEILGNIEAGVDEAGKGEVDSEAIVIGLGDIAGKYGYNDIDEPTYGKCQEAAEEMVTYLKKNKKNGTIITLMWSPRDSGYIWSDYAKKAAGDNGLHVGVFFNGRVYCNVHPYGLSKQQWIDDFNCQPPAIKLPPLEVPF